MCLLGRGRACTTRRKFVFFWLFANAQNFINAEHCWIFWQENKLLGARVRLFGHLPQIWMYKLIFCCLFLGNNSSQQIGRLQGGSSYRKELEYMVLFWNMCLAISGIVVPVQKQLKKRAFLKMKSSLLRNSGISKLWKFFYEFRW